MPSIVITEATPQGKQVWSARAAWGDGLYPGLMLDQHREGQKLITWVVHEAPDDDGRALLWGDADDALLDLQAGDSLMVIEVEAEEDEFDSMGLGDIIAEVTKAFGIPPCNSCEERRKWLNEHIPKLYRRRS